MLGPTDKQVAKAIREAMNDPVTAITAFDAWFAELSAQALGTADSSTKAGGTDG